MTCSYISETYASCFDPFGNAYVATRFSDTLFVEADTFNTGDQNNIDFVLVKYNQNGNILWIQYFYGPDNNTPNTLVTDSSGIYIVGFSSQTMYVNNDSIVAQGIGSDIFQCKLDTAGNFLWGSSSGDAVYADYATSCCLDNDGNLHSAGYFSENATFGQFSRTCTSGYDFCLIKQDVVGNILWVAQIAGSASDYEIYVSTDTFGNVYVSGVLMHTYVEFRNSSNIIDTTIVTGDLKKGFVAKYDSSGFCTWAKHFPGTGENDVWALAVSPSGDIFVGGKFQDTLWYTATDYIVQSPGLGGDGILLHLDTDGNAIEAPLHFSGTTIAQVFDVVFHQDTLFVALAISGSSSLVDLDPDSINQVLIASSNGKIAVIKYVWTQPSLFTTDSLFVDICGGDSTFFGASWLDQSGMYTDTIGDTIQILNLTVNPVYSEVEDSAICDGEIFTWQGTDYSAAGTYFAKALD